MFIPIDTTTVNDGERWKTWCESNCDDNLGQCAFCADESLKYPIKFDDFEIGRLNNNI